MSLSKHNHVNLFSSSFQIFCNIIYFGDFFLLKMILSIIFHKFSKYFLDFHQIFMIFCITLLFFYLLEHQFYVHQTIFLKNQFFLISSILFIFSKYFPTHFSSFSLEIFFIFNHEITMIIQKVLMTSSSPFNKLIIIVLTKSKIMLLIT